MFIVAPALSANGAGAAIDALRRALVAPALPAGAIPVVGAVPDPAAPPNPFAQALAGRTVAAMVVTRADDQHGIVSIEGRNVPVIAQLPVAGETLTLRFAAAAPAPGSGPALPVAAMAGAVAPPVTVGALAQALSEMARLPVTPVPLGAIPAAIDHPQAWADALAGVLRDSGVFYESHVARWSLGQYPLSVLRREPQAMQSLSRAIGDGVQAIAGASAAAVGESASARAIPEVIPEAMRGIVREQLDMLENRSLTVAIDAWPGQSVRLTIHDDGDAAPATDAPARAWTTTIKLDLPRLGTLHARLALRGDHLTLAVIANPASAARLDESATGFSAALANAGITLAGVRIDHDAAH